MNERTILGLLNRILDDHPVAGDLDELGIEVSPSEEGGPIHLSTPDGDFRIVVTRD